MSKPSPIYDARLLGVHYYTLSGKCRGCGCVWSSHQSCAWGNDPETETVGRDHQTISTVWTWGMVVLLLIVLLFELTVLFTVCVLSLIGQLNFHIV